MFFAAAGLVVAAVVLLATGSWVALGAVLVVHALATAAVIAWSLRLASKTEDKPSATEEALQDREEYSGDDEERRVGEQAGRDHRARRPDRDRRPAY